MSQSVSDAKRQQVVRKAIQQAQASAPKDDAAFVSTLRAYALAGVGAQGGTRAMAAGTTKRSKGAKLDQDPRYLANIRKMAKKATSNTRIIGGSAVTGKTFHDCVAVGDDNSFRCTGTLIAPNVVLTAGHCLVLHKRVFIGNDVNKKGTIVKVVRHVRHKDYGPNNNKNDVMLLILEKKVIGVKPRKMASTSLINAATDARVVGFGTTDLAGTTGYGPKQQTDVPIVSNACSGKVGGKNDGKVYGCHLGKEIVAGKPLLLHDTCKGDSGGPLYIANSKGEWLLAGVTSRGTDLATTMCGDGGVYVRVDKYKSWIKSAAK